jgi:two-component system LytT family response regulator
VRISDISRIEAEGNYVCVHSGREKHLHRETMADMEERLSAKRFVRVSRSALVNLEYVREWQPLFNGDSVVLMTSGEQVRVSRNYRDRLQRWIKE